MIPTLSDSDCRQLLPLVRCRHHRGLLFRHDKIACITDKRISVGRGIDKTAALRLVDDESVERCLKRAKSIPLEDVSRVTARRGGKRTRRMSVRIESSSTRLKTRIDQDEVGHFLQMLETKFPGKVTIKNRVAIHGWWLNLLVLTALCLAVWLMIELPDFLPGLVVLVFSVLPLLVLQVYDHLPAKLSWEVDAKEKKKKKKPVKDRSGVEPFRSKFLGWTLKIVSVVLLAYLTLAGLLIFAPIPLVLLYLGNMLATVPPRLVRQTDTRAPILYLRSFLDDRKSTLTPDSGAAILMGVVPPTYLPSPWRYLFHFHPVRVLRIFLGRSVDTSEEQLALFFRKFGPFVAIGRPGETFSTPGASRMYVTNEEWQNVVLEHLDSSQVILLQPAKTEGIWWEVEKTFANVDPRRVLLCMVNFHERQNDYERFRVRAESFLGHPLPRNLAYTETSVFLYFDENWRPMVQQVSCRAPVTWPFVGDTVDLQYTLQSFLDSAGISASTQSSTGQEPAEAESDDSKTDADESETVAQEETAAAEENAPVPLADAAAPARPIPVAAAINLQPPRGLSATSQVLGLVVNFALLLSIPFVLSLLLAMFGVGRTDADPEWSDEDVAGLASEDFDNEPFDPAVPDVDLGMPELESDPIDTAEVPEEPLDEAGVLRKEADQLYRNGELEAALAKVNASLELNKENARTFVSRGDVLETMGRRDEAIQDYERALQLDPKSELAWNNLGYTYLRLGKPDEAVPCFTKAIELNAKGANYFADRGIAHRMAGRIDQAIDDITQSLKLDPNQPYAYYEKGKTLALKGQWIDAIQHFNTAIQMNPKITDAYLHRGRAFLAIGDQKSEEFNPFELARNDFDVCLERIPQATRIWIDRAEASRREGKPEDAIADLDKFLSSEPEDPVMLERRMELLYAAGRNEEAISEADRIAKLFPEDPSKLILPTAMMFALKRYEDVLEKADEVIASHPELLAAYRFRGNSLFFLNRPEEAVEAFERALELDPDDAESLSNLAAICAQTDQFPRAGYWYRRQIKIQPDQFDPHYFLCYVQAARGNWPAFMNSRDKLNQQFGAGAAPQLQMLMLRLDLLGPRSDEQDWTEKNELAKSLHQLNPRHSDLALLDGAMRALAGEWSEAEEILQTLVDTSGDPRVKTSAQVWLAFAQAKQGKGEAASTHLAEAKTWVETHAALPIEDPGDRSGEINVVWWQRVEFQKWLNLATRAVNRMPAENSPPPEA